MKYLLDTHIFLWFITDNEKLNQSVKYLLEGEHELFLSAASLWEIALKQSLEQLIISAPYEGFINYHLKVNHINILDIKTAHLTQIIDLPFHHQNPFDRLLIAQAMVEKIPIISSNDAFNSYPVKRIYDI